MRIKKAMVYIIAFLFSISFVYAQDYALFSGKFHEPKGEQKIEFEHYNATYNICENEAKTIPILFVNKANADEKYSLQAFGASWLSLDVKEFSLGKRQSGVIFLNLNPGEQANGKYSIVVNALSSGNIRRDLNIDVNVEKCYALNLELETEKDKICGGENKAYSGRIKNLGKQENNVGLNVKAPDWISVDEDSLSIGADEEEEFELNADAPQNANGNFDVVVSAFISSLPSIISEKTLSIEAVPKYDCYKADVIADEKITNYYSNEYVPIKIRNNGIKQAEYQISFDAPDWVSVEPEKIVVNPGQFGNTNLNLNPANDAAEGAYAVKINAEFEDVVYSKDIIVALKKSRMKNIKLFLAFYQYYIYVVLFIVILLLIFRRKIASAIKTRYKKYKIRRIRLKALEKAREAKKNKKR